MFDPSAYGEEVAKILALDGDGQRVMPLVQRRSSSRATREVVKAAKVAPLLRAGLYLYFDYWDEAHTVAQDIETAEGSYWHGIVHRQEPDAGNAGYWFRKVGAHAIFPALQKHAEEAGIARGTRWDPIEFIEYCERAKPGSVEEVQAQVVQLAEWQLLFDWCATH